MSMIINPYLYGTVGGDPSFANVSLLMGFEGVDASTSFVDESSYHHTMTAGDNGQIDTAQFKFGTSSYLGDGSNDRVSCPDHAAFEFAAGQFTVEGWMRVTTTSGVNHTMVAKQSDSNSGPAWTLFLGSDNNLYFGMSPNTNGTGAVYASAASGMIINTWYHLAADRDGGGKTRLYRNGTMIASHTTSVTIPGTTGQIEVGSATYGGSRGSVSGWLDEVRVTKGTARYANDGGFTPPTAAFPRS